MQAVSHSDGRQTKGMDEMDPQTISVLAARVALERLDTIDNEQHPPTHRQSGLLARLTRLIGAPIRDHVASRRSPTRAAGPLPLGSASDG
jgi:hypothetical protein